MDSKTPMVHTTPENIPWKDYLLIILLSAVIYLPFLGLSRWGENEPLRVMVAKGMLNTGNWTTPTLEGRPYFLKPPLMNWLIALSARLFGALNEWSSRLPSAAAITLTAISTHLLTKNRLTRSSRLFSAIAVVSMVGLIKKGRTAEVEALLTLCVTLSLLVWINGYLKRWRPAAMWGISLFLVGIGFLAKGPQAVAYFYSTVFVYLVVIKKRPSFFFSISHLFSAVFFFLPLFLYLPFVLREMPPGEYARIMLGEITQRDEVTHLSFLEHIISYPYSTVMSFMPWILFAVPAIAFKEIRGKAREVLKNEMFVYSLAMVAVNFPIYWFLPGARGRYFLPAGPFAAISLAVMFEIYLKNENTQPSINTFFKAFLKCLLWLALLYAALTPAAAVYLNLRFTPPLVFLSILLGLTAAALLYRAGSVPLKDIPVYTAIVIGLAFLIYFNIRAEEDFQKGDNPKRVAGEINLLLPDDVTTVYNIGYRSFQEVTCYIGKDVIQADNFARLKSLGSKGKKVYFIFNAALVASNIEDSRLLTDEIKWENVYSKHLERGNADIVVGYLR
ncbi:MAG: glycosyltransferase family 39 protein [Deltaproteobacteria bacterium]|nr:glycosyltransferase family 39 protein [Deltaproteobacteria bacterium]